jgi:hypothetical protein
MIVVKEWIVERKILEKNYQKSLTKNYPTKNYYENWMMSLRHYEEEQA